MLRHRLERHVEAKNHFRIDESPVTIFTRPLTAFGARFIILHAPESNVKQIVL